MYIFSFPSEGTTHPINHRASLKSTEATTAKEPLERLSNLTTATQTFSCAVYSSSFSSYRVNNSVFYRYCVLNFIFIIVYFILCACVKAVNDNISNMVQCFVPDCNHRSVVNTCRFHRFPKSDAVRNRWIRYIK